MTCFTIFLTGATGFLGTNLVKQLALSGWRVYALKRANSHTRERRGSEVEWHDGDITLKESVQHDCPDNVDAFFHVAADTSMWRKKNTQQNSVNLTGTENAIDAAIKRQAKRFIHTSSIAAGRLFPADHDDEQPRQLERPQAIRDWQITEAKWEKTSDRNMHRSKMPNF